MTSTIIYAIVHVLGLISIGVLARRLGYLSEFDTGRWSRVVVDFLLPALAFHTIMNNLDADRLRVLWFSPVIAFGMMAVGAFVGYLLAPRGAQYSPEFVRTFRHFCAMNNYSFLPIVLVQRVWGSGALAEFFIFNLGSELAYWTVGVTMLTHHPPWQTARRMLSPNLIVILLAVVLKLAGCQPYIPLPVLELTRALGAGAVPLILILAGAGLHPLIPHFHHKLALTALVALRLLIIPAINLTLLHLLPLATEVRRLACVVAVMPSALMSVILSRRYAGDPELAAEVALATTLLSVITVPLILGWLLR
ncbi:MAG: AEC family transporter [Verrucomicrobia bacterium]|nr:AEC family transporter [Verrucomicrobiota bacterium]